MENFRGLEMTEDMVNKIEVMVENEQRKSKK